MSSELMSSSPSPRQSKMVSLGLLVLGVVALGLGGVGAVAASSRHSETMTRLNQLEGRLGQASRDRDQDETERVSEYIKQDIELARGQKDGRNLWVFVAIGGAVICAAGGLLFVRGRAG